MLRMVSSRTVRQCCLTYFDKASSSELQQFAVNNHVFIDSKHFSYSSPLNAKGKKKKKLTEPDEANKDGEVPKAPAMKIRKSKGNHQEKFLKKKPVVRRVDVWDGMNINDLAERNGRDPDDIFEAIMYLNDDDARRIRSLKDPISRKILMVLASKMGNKNNFIANPYKKIETKIVVDKDVYKRSAPEPGALVGRPPVVTIMGHIDHGKTSLLDFLRKSRIVAGEHGGITQHIGAFTVTLDNGNALTFIDTPGHAAFTGMRSRGANITDIVILIIDACEGVLEQTRESLRMIRQSRAPLIVALNKIDKENADVDRVKEQLKEEGVSLEDHGGDVQCVPISALKGTNVPKLIEELLTLAEVLELKCEPSGLSEGAVIESQVEQGLGRTATVLLQRGTLKTSQFIVSDKTWCRVRLLLDDRGNRLDEIKPSQAAKVVGWKDLVPGAGSEVIGVESEARAKEVVAWRRAKELQTTAEMQQENIDEKRKMHQETYEAFRMMKLKTGYFRPRFGCEWNPRLKETEAESDHPKVSVIVKGDVDGSVEAILSCFETYTSPDVDLDIVSFGVGQVNENDLAMAEKFSAIVYAFNTSIPHQLEISAQDQDVSVRKYNVIYHLINDLKAEISDKMPLAELEEVLGRATVLQLFNVTVDKKKVPVAGTRVTQGKISRGVTVRVLRENDVVFEGNLSSLKIHKDEVSEVRGGQECGIRLEDDPVELQQGDQIISFTVKAERQKTDWDPGF